MKKILLIEDDIYLSEIYRTFLEKEGFKCFSAKDGISGLKMIKKIKPDLVILDIIMPNLDGWEVLKKIKEKFSNLKVFVLSNLDSPDEIKKALSLGAERYFIKVNFQVKEVVREVKKYLKNGN